MPQYQTYGENLHMKPRVVPLADECQTFRLPRAECGCPGCCESRYPVELVESDAGEAQSLNASTL